MICLIAGLIDITLYWSLVMIGLFFIIISTFARYDVKQFNGPTSYDASMVLTATEAWRQKVLYTKDDVSVTHTMDPLTAR